MARIRTGNPNGRPAASTEGKTSIDMLMKNVPIDIINKIDRLRKKPETRKDFLVRMVKELAE